MSIYQVLCAQSRVHLGFQIPLVAVDTHYYGKQVITPLNIILYNIFGQGGPDLYG